MSTCLHLRCVSHYPPIDSGEVGHNLTALPQVQADVKNRSQIVKVLGLDDDWELVDDGRMATARFLRQHPACDLELWDEYGKRHPLDLGDMAEADHG